MILTMVFCNSMYAFASKYELNHVTFMITRHRQYKHKKGGGRRKKYRKEEEEMEREMEKNKARYTLYIYILASRGAVFVISLLFAALRAEHCCNPYPRSAAPRRSRVCTVRYY